MSTHEDMTGENDAPSIPVLAEPPKPQYLQAGSSSMATLRVTYEAMATLAMGKTRDDREVIQRSIDGLRAHPEAAAKSAYSIPFKTHTDDCKKRPWAARKNCACPISWVRGPSVNLALWVAGEWKYCVEGARVFPSGDDNGEATVEGFFLDLVNVRMVVRQRIVSRFRKKRDGSSYHISQDDYWQEVERNASKMHRNAVLKGIPRHVIQPVYETGLAIHKEMIQEEGIAETWGRVLGFFSERGVTEEMVCRLMGKSGFEEVRAEDVANLRHLVQSIGAGFQSIGEVFQMPDNASPPVGDVGGAASTERED